MSNVRALSSLSRRRGETPGVLAVKLPQAAPRAANGLRLDQAEELAPQEAGVANDQLVPLWRGNFAHVRPVARIQRHFALQPVVGGGDWPGDGHAASVSLNLQLIVR